MGLVGEFVDLVIIVSLLEDLLEFLDLEIKQEVRLWRQLTNQRQQHQQHGDENRVHVPKDML